MQDDPANLTRALKVLGVVTRVRIVQLLRERALCVNALAARLDVTQGAVSQHLRVMRDAGLVIDERRGYHVHYRLNEETLARWRTSIDAFLAPPERGSTENAAPEEVERPCVAMRRIRDAKNRGT